VKYTDS